MKTESIEVFFFFKSFQRRFSYTLDVELTHTKWGEVWYPGFEPIHLHIKYFHNSFTVWAVLMDMLQSILCI